MNFYYQAVSKDGERIKGSLQANSKKRVANRLKSEGYYIMEIKQSTKPTVSWLRKLKGITDEELALFSRQLTTLLKSGLSLINVLSVLEEQITNIKLKQAIIEVNQDIQAGNSLAQALAQHNKLFPQLMIDLISVGEKEGILEQVLEQVTSYLEARTELRQRLRSILVYPLFILITSLGVIIFLFLFVLPTFSSVFADYNLQLPLVTRYLLQTVSFIKTNFYLLLGIAVSSLIAIISYLKTQAGQKQLDQIILKSPLVGNLMLKILLVRLTRTLGIILKGGGGLLVGLDNLQGVANNQILEEKLGKLQTKVEQGQSLSFLLESDDLFPKLLTQMVKVGEQTGELGPMLLKVADYYNQELKYELEMLVSLVEPLIILLLSSFVFIVLISVLLPLFNLINFI
ncbi:type II secretory pathway, component PulF [Halobacteroides halobius DSM 5150]|uniref:Type II secretory pathway, component PulF n=1 Tax=Halobacteroides halobius (strain ATCC 35273 / DSM 5150 / MD-1) TaxID=748449 RepID=L0K647_HALHC|nr:type II secretion system F family protein [Halobacteroides halobius]AGB40491.1 type II secretory pathway, component PulF [Halobacteroides halobius DSM 5150]